MTGYVAMRWAPADRHADRAAHKLRVCFDGLGWTCLVDEPGWAVAVDDRARGTIPVKVVDKWAVVIGHAFDRATTDRGRVVAALIPRTVADFATLCDDLVARSWGNYVAVGSDADDAGRLDIFRDPVGMTECLTWACGALRIVSSVPHLFLDAAPPADLAIDWPRVAELLLRPAFVGEEVPLAGLVTVGPGTLMSFRGTDVETTVKWVPAWFAARSGPPPGVAGAVIARAIDGCVAAWASRSTRAIGELSGGLDSALVAAALAKAPSNSVVAWYNYRATDPQGDERHFARAVADRLDLPLVERLRDERVIDAAVMDALPVESRPNIGSLSLFHDRDLAGQGMAVGADALFTGQGGDALFFQPATPLVAADLWRDPRPLRQKCAMLFDIAIWTRRPIWNVLASAAWSRAQTLPAYPIDLVAKDWPRTTPSFAWAAGTGRLTPAKQLQILNLAACRGSFANSWCAQAMDVVHPLMSQPVLETILPIPALELTGGRRDRLMVREAYAARLPASLIGRRGKGSLTAFFGRMLAASAPFLRDYLLDGVLADARLLDRDRLETILDANHLMQHDAYAELLMALLMERWARVWTGRIAEIRAAARAPVAA